MGNHAPGYKSVKKALNKRGMNFDSRKELIESAKKIGKIKFKFDYETIFQRSLLLKKIKTQRNLKDWF